LSLLSMVREHVARDPEATAAIDSGEVPVSRGDLLRRALWLRAELARSGIGRGDCVAVWLPNWSDAVIWQLAVASLGAHVIGVNTRYNVDEVRHVLERARPSIVAVAHEFHGLDLIGTLRRAAEGVATIPAVAVVPGPHGQRPGSLDRYDLGVGAWCPEIPGGEPPDTGDERDELAVAFTTSGSTGLPKLAAHKESAVVGHARADAAEIGIGPGDVVVCVLPLSGVFGFSTAMAALAGGATCLLEPVFDADRVLDHMAASGATHLVGGDDMIGRLRDAWQDRPRDLSTLRWIGIADFLGRSAELGTWAGREFGAVTTGVYGSSEVFALTASWPPDEPGPRRWTGGGTLITPGMAVRAVDPVSDKVVADGDQGELQFRGPNVVDAYLGDPDAAARSFTADGWFRSGDLGAVLGPGSFEYVCRMGDVLRLSGFLVDPAEIERRLAGHAAVGTAKVVGTRAADGSTVAVGFVVLDDSAEPAEPEELRAWCAAALARFKVPAAIEVLDEMPTTSGTNGTKIKTATLREWARQTEIGKAGR
jgi:acyl-CoA synthetase (AMP-forming)/AMP-acid ligase II